MMSATTLNFTHVHVNWARDYFDPQQFDLFVIVTREPVSRTISSFNWKHTVGGGEIGPYSPGQLEMSRCFPELPGGVNGFAEALDEESDCGLVARRAMHDVEFGAVHLPMDTHWYVGAGLRKSSPSLLATLRDLPDRRALVIPTENFSAGADAMWDWLCVPRGLRPAEAHAHTEYPRMNDTHVSPKGLDNIRRHTVLERLALEELAGLADNW